MRFVSILFNAVDLWKIVFNQKFSTISKDFIFLFVSHKYLYTNFHTQNTIF